MVHMVCRTSQLAQNCLYLGLNTKTMYVRNSFWKKNPSAAIIRQTYTKVLTAHRETDKVRGILKCSNTELFVFLTLPVNAEEITGAKLPQDTLETAWVPRRRLYIISREVKPGRRARARARQHLVSLLHPGSSEFGNPLDGFCRGVGQELLGLALQNGRQRRVSEDWVWYWGGRQRLLFYDSPRKCLQQKRILRMS